MLTIVAEYALSAGRAAVSDESIHTDAAADIIRFIISISISPFGMICYAIYVTNIITHFLLAVNINYDDFDEIMRRFWCFLYTGHKMCYNCLTEYGTVGCRRA